VRDVLNRIPEPPESPTFFDELWRRAENADRSAARRWRRVAIAVVAAAITAAASVGVVAATRSPASTFDSTVRCSLEDRGGVPAFSLAAYPGLTTPTGFVISSSVIVTTGSNTQLLFMDWKQDHFRLDEQNCHAAPRIPLSRAGLPHVPQVFRRGQHVQFDLDCTVGKLVFRLWMKRSSGGKVTEAKLAVRATKKAKPIAYVDWTPAKLTAYSVPPSACSAY
jgi:hypothetical protein